MILTDDGYALVEPRDFADLPDYSCSIPTGKTIGKRWKRMRVFGLPEHGWVMGEYAEDPDPKYVRIVWRDLEVVG